MASRSLPPDPRSLELGALRARLEQLVRSLEVIVADDTEQEVQGLALPVLDAVVSEGRRLLGDDPVISVVAEVISPDFIASGEPVRAADALIVAGQLVAVLEALQRKSGAWGAR